MPGVIKPIETQWMGFRFRSRTEARWAVFFTAMGWRWEYEPEGFQFPDGFKYLPDFQLFIEERKLWIEIKPYRAPDASEIEKAKKLEHYSKQTVLFLCGVPSLGNDSYRIVEVDTSEFYEPDGDEEEFHPIEFSNPHILSPCRKCDSCEIFWNWDATANNDWVNSTGWMIEKCRRDRECTDKIGPGDWSRINKALAAASSERFGT